jgi:hypothetical protein
MHGHYLVEWTAKTVVFLDMKPRNLVRVNVLEGCVFISLVLKLKAADFSETLDLSTQLHGATSHNCKLHIHRCNNFRSHRMYCISMIVEHASAERVDAILKFTQTEPSKSPVFNLWSAESWSCASSFSYSEGNIYNFDIIGIIFFHIFVLSRPGFFFFLQYKSPIKGILKINVG